MNVSGWKKKFAAVGRFGKGFAIPLIVVVLLVATGEQGKAEEAVAAHDHTTPHSANDDAPDTREKIVRTLVDKGVALAEQGKIEEAIATYDDIVQRFGADDSPTVHELVAKALHAKGTTLTEQGRVEEAITLYDEIVRRFEDAPSFHVRKWAAWALDSKSATLMGQHKYEEAIAAYDEIVQRFGNDALPDMRQQAILALNHKQYALEQQNKCGEAFAVDDDIAQRFGNDDSPDLREWVANTLYNSGAILEQQGRTEEARTVFSTIVQRFGNDNAPIVREQVAKVLAHKNGTLERQDANLETQIFATVEPFYAWVLNHRFVSVPSEQERSELAAFLMPELIQLLKATYEMHDRCFKAAKEGDKPVMLEGALLVGLYEGATDVSYGEPKMEKDTKGMATLPVILLYQINHCIPKGSRYRMSAWRDELELIQKEGKWFINNIHFPHGENLRSNLQDYLRTGHQYCDVP